MLSLLLRVTLTSFPCEQVGTKVLEDEMYMSEIIMMSEDMGMAWHNFPLEQCPSLNIYWEYGVFYPMSRYFYPVVAAAEKEISDCADDADRQMRELKRLLQKCVFLCVCSACLFLNCLLARRPGFQLR
jgi:hypothetical protein